ncbi:MAG: Zn-dependent protease with chaperone function [Gammaproteobacteria bacterium]
MSRQWCRIAYELGDPVAKALTTAQRRERFEALVSKAERLIEKSPQADKVRIGALALLGDAVIFGVLFTLVIVLGGTLWAAFASTALFLLLLKKKANFLLAIAAWALLKALWVRFERPHGEAVTAAQAPELFAVIRDISGVLNLPRIHEALLTDEFTAGVAQSPRLGVLGWQRTSLLLGVPLLLALSPEEMRAVSAHEAGHLSGNRSRFNAWIYRVCISWYRIMASFDEAEGFGAGLMRRFFDGYAPYCNAMSFALARANEYEADAVAVELTSQRAAASALAGASVRGDVASQEYWQPLLRRARNEAEPKAAPCQGSAPFHASHEAELGHLRERIAWEMNTLTGHADTHPALNDQLAAIGGEPGGEFTVFPSAAHAWLGDALPSLLATFDSDWVARNAQSWREQYQETREAIDALDALAARPRNELESLELWRLATLTEQYGLSDGQPGGQFDDQSNGDTDRALTLFREYAKQEPQDVGGDFVIGRLLLARDDQAGVHYMARAADHFQLALNACEYLYSYYLRVGDEAAAQHWRDRGEVQIDLQNEASAERSGLHKKDAFLPSELSPQWLENLVEQLSAMKTVRHAFIAHKQVEINPQSALYVIAISTSGWFTRNAEVVQSLADELEVPGECFFVARAGDT